MGIKSKIETVLNSLDDINTVVYQDVFKANVSLDNVTFPCAVMFLIVDGGLNLSNDIYKEVADVQLFFIDKIDYDSNGDEVEAVAESMRNIAKKFIQLSQDSAYKITSNEVLFKTIYDEYDVNVCGINFNFTAQEKQGVCANTL